MMELADVADSKSADSDIVRVQVPLPAPDLHDGFDMKPSCFFIVQKANDIWFEILFNIFQGIQRNAVSSFKRRSSFIPKRPHFSLCVFALYFQRRLSGWFFERNFYSTVSCIV